MQQKVGQSARSRPTGQLEVAQKERKGDRLWAFFSHLIGSPFSILHVRKGIDVNKDRRREKEIEERGEGKMITRVFLTQKARKPTPKYDEQQRAL